MVYGSLDNPKLTYSKNVNLRAGVNKVSLLSVSVGLAVSKKKIPSTFSSLPIYSWFKSRAFRFCLSLRILVSIMRGGIQEFLVLSL